MTDRHRRCYPPLDPTGFREDEWAHAETPMRYPATAVSSCRCRRFLDLEPEVLRSAKNASAFCSARRPAR